jgi:acetolactate synthase I/II/III large subunit
MKFAEEFADWLVEEGYTHCFFVAGGNIMHLLDAARTRFACVPFVHEGAAGIAAEYCNEVPGPNRAFVLVTAGPGLTNVVTAMAGAFLESRELLVVGGQVKSSDLASGGVRQRGIQEIDGVALAAPVCKAVLRIEKPVDRGTVVDLVRVGRSGRPGPVFLEVCLDAQASPVEPALSIPRSEPAGAVAPTEADCTALQRLLADAHRPVILLGGGVTRAAAVRARRGLERLGVPVMTTWNGADRLPADHPLYAGRPNTWGQRAANVLVQQADLLIALGTRLGLQQTGFNWQEFVPNGAVVQVDIDPDELAKGHPHVEFAIRADADAVLAALVESGAARDDVSEWRAFVQHVRTELPSREAVNTHAEGYVCPFEFAEHLSDLCRPDDVVVPCSSGGAFTVMMQTFRQRDGQVIVTDKGLASMGYGLSGALGAAIASGHRTILVEGDGGFAQNLQELGTLAALQHPVKVFVFDNNGYASIRMTQRNYFDGAHVGCDADTGLGLPDWSALFAAFGIPVLELAPGFETSPEFLERFDSPGPAGFVVPVDPDQTYFPKISSRVTEAGSMESAPLHEMTPQLPEEVVRDLLRHLPPTLEGTA